MVITSSIDQRDQRVYYQAVHNTKVEAMVGRLGDAAAPHDRAR